MTGLPHRRVLVYGVTGSGKSTAALRLGAATGLPAVLADEIAWLPGWVLTGEDEQRRIFGDIASGERWVLDKKPVCNGNTESFRLLLRRDSILV